MTGSFLPQTGSTLVNVKLTDKGRELLTKGFFDQDTFDVVKFSFGDSEVDYSLADDDITGTTVSRPDNFQVDFKSKLYAKGTIPVGTPKVILNLSELALTQNQAQSVTVTTFWPPVEGEYVENFRWENLGPLEDWEYQIVPSNNSRSANIIAYDVAGEAQVKVVGLTTGRYAILNLTIE